MSEDESDAAKGPGSHELDDERLDDVAGGFSEGGLTGGFLDVSSIHWGLVRYGQESSASNQGPSQTAFPTGSREE